jgi:putative transposase
MMNTLCRESLGRNCEPSAAILDSQSIKTAPFVSEEVGFDGNKKVKGRKRHILTDTVGLIWGVHLTAANVHDTVAGGELLQSLVGRVGIRLQKIFVDQGYRGDWADQVIWDIEVVEKAPLGQISPIRWIVERTLGWLAHPRRLSKDYEMKIVTSKAWIQWAGILLALNKIKQARA